MIPRPKFLDHPALQRVLKHPVTARLTRPAPLIRLAGIWLTVLGLLHDIGFTRWARNPQDFDLGRALLYEGMSGYVPGATDGGGGATFWDIYVFFSLGHGFGLMVSGLALVYVAGTSDATLRLGFVKFTLLFWLIATVAWIWMTGVVAPLLILFGLLPLLGFAWRGLARGEA